MRNITRDGETGDGSSLMTMRATQEVLDVLSVKMLAGQSLPQTKDPKDTVIQVVVNKATVDYTGLSLKRPLASVLIFRVSIS